MQGGGELKGGSGCSVRGEVLSMPVAWCVYVCVCVCAAACSRVCPVRHN